MRDEQPPTEAARRVFRLPSCALGARLLHIRHARPGPASAWILAPLATERLIPGWLASFGRPFGVRLRACSLYCAVLGQHARLAPIPAALVLLLGLSGLARAQDAYSWSRYHAEPPLGSVLPEALPPPPSPVEGGKLGEQPTRDLVENLDGTYSYEETGFTAHVDGEGRVTLKDKPSIQAHIFISPLFLAAFGTFDATDMAMRWLGEDPYLYQKKAFLERTFEERARMRERHTRQTMSRALRELPAYLERIWRYEVWPSELRKRVLFALWDECAEDGNPTMVAGGAKARRAIEGFVRSHLAPGTPDAFQPEEIARLNQLRTSKARFSPYGGPRSGQVMVAGSPPAPSPE